MTPPITEAVRDVLSQGRPGEAVAIIQHLDPAAAAVVLAALPFEEQQMLFRLLPVDFAAAVVSHFPYYHAYVLLHSRPLAEMRAMVDKLDPTERIRFFDELPEEAWQRFMDELAAAPAEAPQPAVVAPIVPAPAVEKIIEARQVEKSFRQPDGREIQVIAPLDLCVESGVIIALLGPSGSRQIDAAANPLRARSAVARRGPVAREATGTVRSQRRHRFPELRAVPLAHGAGERRSAAAGARRCRTSSAIAARSKR